MRPVLRLFSAAVSFVLFACASTPPPLPPPATLAAQSPPAAPTIKPAPEQVAANSPRATAGGTTFIVPGGWSIESDSSRSLLTGPEPDIRVAIVDGSAKSADEAVASAWRAVYPDFNRPLRISQPRPARDGWDERLDYTYETSPNEKIIVSAVALRHGEAWTAVLSQYGRANFERRLAQVALLGQSLRPKGYVKESFAGRTANTLDAERVKRILEMVDRGRQAIGVPGVAISLVQGGKVIYQGGLGERELGKPQKVDANTLFMIASNTKALTTLLLATEVDQGKFTWDTPVTQVYPSFKLGNAETTKKVLMKHLICACTGLPRQDYEWLFEFKNRTAESVISFLGSPSAQPTTGFGETFQYSNPLAAAAGFIGGRVAYPKKELGAAYDLAMQKRVFDPLGMKDTTFNYERALARNHSTPHSPDIDGKMAIASMDLNRGVIPVRPAGAAWSTVKDVTRYVQMELANGKLPNGRQLVSEQVLLERRVAQVPIGQYGAYGMGLMVDKEFRVPVVHHGGDVTGFHSDMFWLPEHGVGGVILTNADGGWLLRGPFIRKVLEELFDGKPEAAEDVESAAVRLKAEIAKARERLVVPPDPDAVARLASHYSNEALGTIDIRENGSGRVFDFGEWRSSVASRKNDDGTTSMITIDPGVYGFQFVIADRDGKRALIIRDSQHEYVFLEGSPAPAVSGLPKSRSTSASAQGQ